MNTIKFNLPQDVQLAFTEGDCWLLAQHINEISDWPLHWVGSTHGSPCDSWCHIYVRHPSGLCVDVTGAWSESEFMGKWRRTAKRWGCISTPTEFGGGKVTTPAEFSNMVLGMRPEFSHSRRWAQQHGAAIVEKMGTFL